MRAKQLADVILSLLMKLRHVQHLGISIADASPASGSINTISRT